LILLAAGLGAAPFSHKLHLELNLGCTQCHTSAAASTSPADNNLPDAKVCAPCHQGSPRTIKQPRQTNVTHFNHALHLKLGNPAPVIVAAVKSGAYLSPAPAHLAGQLAAAKVACAACHRGLESNQQVDASVFPAMADCLVCHPKVDPPFSCEKCHASGPALKPASHVGDFFDTHSSKKVDKVSCAVCHGRKFTCQGCH
jgi:hypothetical protein